MADVYWPEPEHRCLHLSTWCPRCHGQRRSVSTAGDVTASWLSRGCHASLTMLSHSPPPLDWELSPCYCNQSPPPSHSRPATHLTVLQSAFIGVSCRGRAAQAAATLQSNHKRGSSWNWRVEIWISILYTLATLDRLSLLINWNNVSITSRCQINLFKLGIIWYVL